jgi:hypothetical protein
LQVLPYISNLMILGDACANPSPSLPSGSKTVLEQKHAIMEGFTGIKCPGESGCSTAW